MSAIPSERIPGGRTSGPERVCRVLLVNSFESDRDSIRSIFQHSNWCLSEARSVAAARPALSESGVVLCDEHLPDGSWRDLLAAMEPLHDPPVLIVSSHIADERLWSEVLNLGAFDLLAAPFDSREVLRVVSLAWRWWRSEARHLAVAG